MSVRPVCKSLWGRALMRHICIQEVTFCATQSIRTYSNERGAAATCASSLGFPHRFPPRPEERTLLKHLHVLDFSAAKAAQSLRGSVDPWIRPDEFGTKGCTCCPGQSLWLFRAFEEGQQTKGHVSIFSRGLSDRRRLHGPLLLLSAADMT